MVQKTLKNQELVRFCEWGIKELLNAKDGIVSDGIKDKNLQKKMVSTGYCGVFYVISMLKILISMNYQLVA